MAGFVNWVVGQVLSAADLMKLPQHNYVRKTSDTSRQNTTIISDDPQLLLAVSINTDYILDGLIIYTATESSADFKYTFSAPSGSSMSWHSVGADLFDANHTPWYSISAMLLDSQKTHVGFSSGGTSNPFLVAVRPTGILRVGNTSGNLRMRWAQNTSHADHTVVRANSWIRLTKL